MQRRLRARQLIIVIIVIIVVVIIGANLRANLGPGPLLVRFITGVVFFARCIITLHIGGVISTVPGVLGILAGVIGAGVFRALAIVFGHGGSFGCLHCVINGVVSRECHQWFAEHIGKLIR